MSWEHPKKEKKNVKKIIFPFFFSLAWRNKKKKEIKTYRHGGRKRKYCEASTYGGFVDLGDGHSFDIIHKRHFWAACFVCKSFVFFLIIFFFLPENFLKRIFFFPSNFFFFFSFFLSVGLRPASLFSDVAPQGFFSIMSLKTAMLYKASERKEKKRKRIKKVRFFFSLLLGLLFWVDCK